MGKMVNTVCGPVSVDDLGITLMHEHFIFGYPGYQGDVTCGPFKKDEALKNCIEVVEEMMALGLKTVVDATPNECGRDPLFLKEVSEKTGLNIICASGYYYEGEGAPAYFKQRAGLGDIAPEIYEMFKKEVTEGIADTGIKAGVFKLASSKNEITDYEMVFFKAAARVSREEGIPIITHTQEGTMGPEQAQLLISEGVDPNRIMIGHMGGSTDLDYHLRTLEQGVYIAFDRFGLQGLVGCPMDDRRIACIAGLISAGYVEKIMLSHDVILHWLGRPTQVPEAALPLIANWNWGHIFKNIIPAFKKAGITEEQIHTILVENPKKFFSY
ncbi:MAG: phosphotriesterase-related protein [Syntrophomonadaceae bacterium]|jgi:phosphotriesterase-related protein|nr:phosphotriesterase-related protein [Syntrophomonadaceae bacterium]